MTSAFIAGTLGTEYTKQLGKCFENVSRTRKEKTVGDPKFGRSGFNEQNLDIQKSGQLFFCKEISKNRQMVKYKLVWIKINYVGN